MITVRRHNLLSTQSFCRSFCSPALEKKEGLLKRIKKYAFGEEPPTRNDVEERLVILSNKVLLFYWKIDYMNNVYKNAKTGIVSVPSSGLDHFMQCSYNYKIRTLKNTLKSMQSVSDSSRYLNQFIMIEGNRRVTEDHV